jgi:hypothetical protein
MGGTMRSALRIVAASLGIAAGLAGLEHGYFEILQGNVPPDSLMIVSMGPPCVRELTWNACEPAMTVVPSFLITGVLSIVFSLAILVWSVAFVQRKRGGLGLMLLCIPLLLFGGGIFPPVIGFIGGLVGTRIGTPLPWWRRRFSGGVGRLLASWWPWPLVIFLAWTLAGQWIVGHFFNDFMLVNAWLVPLLVMGLLVVAILSGFAYEVQQRTLRQPVPA